MKKIKKQNPIFKKIFIFQLLILMIILFSSVNLNSEVKQRPLMRYPAIHGDTVVFVYGNDIWKVSSKGGVAQRLTINDGAEVFPRFAPCGKWIAFTGEYDGNPDVYIMDIYGGNIKRVTYHPGYDEVVGWHPVKHKIIFRSSRDSASRYNHLFMIKTDGTGLEELILHEAVAGSFSPDGRKIAYNRVPRENRTWKRYKGGLAQDIYLFDFNLMKDKRITKFRGTDRIPMWIGDKIYFTSDRDGVLNLYSYDTKTEMIKQLTFHKEYDVRRPSYDKTRIVYEYGGTLRIYDTKTGEDKNIPIEIKTDSPETRAYYKNVKRYITDMDISPSGKRALIVARGEIFSAPAKNGSIINITEDSGSRDKDGVWSPDGKKIAYFSDKNGEYNLYIVDAEAKRKPVRLTEFKKGYRHYLKWSPDGKMIAFGDQTLSLYYININTKKIVKVDKAEHQNVDIDQDEKAIYDFNWSPDSRYLAYSKMDKDFITKIYIYSLEDKKVHCVSSGLFNDFEPVFTPDGKHLLFISNRRFNPTFCDLDWEMVYKNLAGIYSITLQKNAPPLFPYKSDKSYVDKSSKKKGKTGNIRIDFKGIADRIEMLNLPQGNYRKLSVNNSTVFYLNSDKGDYNRFKYRDIGPRNLYAFSLKTGKTKTIVKNINNYKLSLNGKYLIYKKGLSISIIKAGMQAGKGTPLNLSGLTMKIEPRKEWKQIYNEAWRIERDYYYEPGMHGVDWKKIKEKYGKLLPYVANRQDIRYLIGEMIGELNTSHTYIFGGDYQRRGKRVNVGLLGVDWGKDKKNNLYYFKKIYKVADWSRNVFPPLARPEINIKSGWYILKVNNKKISGDKNIYSYFENTAGKLIEITVNNKPVLLGAKTYKVKPIYSERTLRYRDWVESNRKKVEKASNGMIGYIHLPDTYMGSAVEFPKYYYSQITKKGLIIDGRYNGGGLDPDIFLRRLNRKVLSYWTRRYTHDQLGPHMTANAHMVLLTNKQAGSGGDELPYEFRRKKMGLIIGTRTWGGLVGVSMFIQLIDGGGITAPDYRIYSPEGKWIIENHGVDPDIVVDLDPVEMSKGYDAQLMKGVEVLLKQIKKEPKKWPKHGAYPVDKSIKK
jgi:tricorn protease